MKIEELIKESPDKICKIFRDDYNIHICCDLSTIRRKNKHYWYVRIDDIVTNEYIYHSEDSDIYFNTYEEAQLAGIEKAIKIIQQ